MSSTTVYAIASGKGGVGKTTTTVNLGTALAGAGHRVAVVDTDLGMANLAGFVNLSPDGPTLHDVLAGEATVEEATYEVAERIGAVPSGTELSGFAEADATDLRAVVDRLRAEFDYVLLDVGAGVSHESVLPLGIADETILVSTPEPASVQDVQKTIDLAERSGSHVAGLVLTRTRSGDKVSYDEIAAQLGVSLLATIPEDDAVRDSVYARTPLVVNTPDSPAASAYRTLGERVANGEGDTDEPAATATDDEPAPSTGDDGVAGEPASADGAEQPASSADVSDALADVDKDEEPSPGTGDAEDDSASAVGDSEPAAGSDEDDIPDEDIDLSLDEDAPASESEETADDSADESDDVVVEAEDDAVDLPDDAPAGSPADGVADDSVTIPDAETDEADSPSELDDDAIPFRGGDSEAGDDDVATDEGGEDAAADDEGADGEDTGDADADDEKEGKGFLGGLF